MTVPDARSVTVTIDGIATHYWDTGDGPPIVLLHAGGFGENAEHSFGGNIGAFTSAGHRVLAPDWLGFGGTDKVYDFADPHGRRLTHMARWFETVGITEAAVVGLSMGGTYLLDAVARKRPLFPATKVVLISGGGFAAPNEARRALMGYDGTFESMRAAIEVLFHDPKWAADDQFVRSRHEAALATGAWECLAAGGFRPPWLGPPSPPPAPACEFVVVPTLLTAGQHDRLREPGWAAALAARIAGCELTVYDCGHIPNIECATAWNDRVIEFLGQP